MEVPIWSTFVSQNAQNTTGSEPFLKFRSGKMARRCGAKHICKSKWKKTDGFGPLFEVQMSKNYSVGKLVSQSISQFVK